MFQSPVDTLNDEQVVDALPEPNDHNIGYTLVTQQGVTPLDRCLSSLWP